MVGLLAFGLAAAMFAHFKGYSFHVRKLFFLFGMTIGVMVGALVFAIVQDTCVPAGPSRPM